jgi:hypothetical protein
MTCPCPSAGYCPVLQTTVYPEQHAQCQQSPQWLAKEKAARGIRTETCQPCEAGAKKPKPAPSRLPPISDATPVVSNRLGRAALSLRGQFAGQRAFLVGGGPSLNTVDITRLARPGVTVAAMNNVATMIRPQLWFCVDMPRNFHETIWRDPGVMKFTFDKHLKRDCSVDAYNGSEFVASGLRAKECPNVWGFNHRHGWDAAHFLDDTVPTWGVNGAHEDPDGKNKQCSVMLPAMWLLYWLGFRVVYLLGCDFTYQPTYAFDEKCDPGNANLFPWLDRRFTELKPHFREHGFTVLNCTEGSALTAFERISLDAALEAVLENWPETVATKGHYRA